MNVIIIGGGEVGCIVDRIHDSLLGRCSNVVPPTVGDNIRTHHPGVVERVGVVSDRRTKANQHQPAIRTGSADTDRVVAARSNAAGHT